MCGSVSGSPILSYSPMCFCPCQHHAGFNPMALKYNLKSDMVIPPGAVLILLSIVLTIQGFLCFSMNVKIALSVLIKNVTWILNGISLAVFMGCYVQER